VAVAAAAADEKPKAEAVKEAEKESSDEEIEGAMNMFGDDEY